MQALAQSTIQDLHSKLAARSVEVEEGGQRLEAAQRQAAAEVGSLQDQIEQLTHQLQLQDQRHIKASTKGITFLLSLLFVAFACSISSSLELENNKPKLS